jgi:hypothetical protein
MKWTSLKRLKTRGKEDIAQIKILAIKCGIVLKILKTQDLSLLRIISSILPKGELIGTKLSEHPEGKTSYDPISPLTQAELQGLGNDMPKYKNISGQVKYFNRNGTLIRIGPTSIVELSPEEAATVGGALRPERTQEPVTGIIQNSSLSKTNSDLEEIIASRTVEAVKVALAELLVVTSNSGDMSAVNAKLDKILQNGYTVDGISNKPNIELTPAETYIPDINLGEQNINVTLDSESEDGDKTTEAIDALKKMRQQGA